MSCDKPDDFFDLGHDKFAESILPEIPADSSVSESELHRVEWENMAKHCGTTVQGIAIFSYTFFFSGRSIGENFDLGIFGSYCFCGCALLATVVASEIVYHHVEPMIYAAFVECNRKKETIKVLCFCGPEISVLLLLDVFFIIGLQGYIYAAWFTWLAGSSSSLWTGWFGWFTGCLLGYRARYCEEPLLHMIMHCFGGFSTRVSDKNQIQRDLSCIGRAVTLCPTPGLLPLPCQSRHNLAGVDQKPTCRLDMISVDPEDLEVPDRLLKISDPFGGFRTLEPGRFCLKSIKLGGEELHISPLVDGETFKQKSEKKIRLEELFRLDYREGKYLEWGGVELAGIKIKKSEPSMSLTLTLGYASFDKHWSAFISHWAVHMVTSSLFCLFLIFPVISVAAELRSMHDEICMTTEGSSSIPSVSHTAVDLGMPWLGSRDLCNDEESCKDLCMDLLHFAGAILEARDISWAELAVPLPLVFVTMLIAALQLALISHDADVNSYIQNCPVDKSQTALLKNYYSMINTSCECGTLLRQFDQIYDNTKLRSGDIDDEVAVGQGGSKNLILVRSMANVGIPPPLCEGTWIQDANDDLDWTYIKDWWNNHAKGSLDLSNDTKVTVTMDILYVCPEDNQVSEDDHSPESGSDDQGSEDDHNQETGSPQTHSQESSCPQIDCCYLRTVQEDYHAVPAKDPNAGPEEGTPRQDKTAELKRACKHAFYLAQKDKKAHREPQAVLPYFKDASSHDVWLLPMYYDEPDPVKDQEWAREINEDHVEGYVDDRLPTDRQSGFTVFRVSAGKDKVSAKQVSEWFRTDDPKTFAKALNLTGQSTEKDVIPKGTYSVYFQVARDDPSASPTFSIVAIICQRGLVVIFALALVMLAPFLRHLHGGDWFPQPFATTLKASTSLQFLALWTFFDYFVVSNTKLGMITKALQNLETNTLAPSKKKKKKNGILPKNNPFDLYVATSELYYHPACSSTWCDYQTEFQKKTSHVKDWHDAVGYLRTFMSGARLSSQVVLVAAAFILATVVLGSIAQAMNGQGAFAVDAEKLIKLAGKKAKQAAAAGTSAIADGANAATKAVGDGAALGFQHAQNLMSDAVTPGRRLLLGAASASLDAVLQPAQLALHHAEFQVLSLDQSRRLSTYTEALDSIDGIDIGKITKMQVLTIAIIIVIAWYSVPLIYRIAETNAFLDRHEQLLVAQQEAHQAKQKERQENFNKVEDCIRNNAIEDIKLTMDDPKKKPRKADDSFEDREKKNYEKMLHTAIAAAKKNRQKFPLSLFGFVINFGLLATWIFLALGPVFDQVKDLAPQLAYKACHSITEKIGDATEGIQDAYNAGAAQVNRDIADAGGVDKVLPLMNLEGFIDKSVCVPLKKWVKKQAKKSIDALEKDLGDDTDAQKALSHRRLQEFIEANSRRLQGLSVDSLEIEKAVEEWWHWTDLPRPAKLILLHSKLFALWQRSQALLKETAKATGVAAPSLNPFNSTMHIDFEAEMVV